jgi:hypothetical protein
MGGEYPRMDIRMKKGRKEGRKWGCGVGELWVLWLAGWLAGWLCVVRCVLCSAAWCVLIRRAYSTPCARPRRPRHLGRLLNHSRGGTRIARTRALDVSYVVP